MHTFKVQEGVSYPLGATPNEGGVNFALFSANATKVELCLFDEYGQKEVARIEVKDCTNQIWHIQIAELEVGARYGYRVHGAYDPQRGARFNPNKLLADPYARKLDRPYRWLDTMFGYESDHHHQDLVMDQRDNSLDVPKSVVTERLNAVQIDEIQRKKPNIPWNETIVYEAHVRGLTQLNLDIPASERGTFKALANPKVLTYLKELGITAIELLPVHGFLDEQFLSDQGLSNYWGYNTLHFFAPHAGYMSSEDPAEFRDVVNAIHEAGLEVIIDVVYNHTAEGNHLGPTLSLRGVDNSSYYWLAAHDSRYYVNDTGCGNTLNVKHPRVLQLVMDSLRYWAGEMGVDGFRFDLASVLGREKNGFDRDGGFFDAVRQDPLLATCKLFAEPWDIGPGGYQVGNFPEGWSEWNDRYRDTCRRFWKGDPGILPEFARRIHGSSDLFEHHGRGPWSSTNLITSHDGFTLCDLVSYRNRHNEANNEQNKDGHHSNFSENYGVEGETTYKIVLDLRERQKRNMLATLFLSQGVPLLLAGDELSKTQDGNNNSYCQDNEINWINWAKLGEKHGDLLEFTKLVIALRKRFQLTRSKKYIHQQDDLGDRDYYCVRWVNSDGQPMQDSHWMEPNERCVGWILERNELMTKQERVLLLVLFNADEMPKDFKLPYGAGIQSWGVLMDTADSKGVPKTQVLNLADEVDLEGRSMQLLCANYDG